MSLRLEVCFISPFLKSNIQRMRYAFGLLLLSVVLSGCAFDKKARLEESIDTYVKSLRRGDEATALAFVHPDKQDQYFQNQQKFGDLYISNAEIKSIFPDEKLESAVATVLLEYFPQNGSSVMTQKRKFTWKYEAKAKAWLLDETTPLGSR
ncbi:MAG: hypothetical protein J0L93_04625 [Deltaproteobacteria bacterium]|nr:hypothetical protein [Deltaproteobacteria bacterium]